MAPMYYRGASAAMLVYDITNPKSLADSREWVNELRANTDHDTCAGRGQREGLSAHLHALLPPK